MENDVRGLFDQLVADPPPTSVTVDAAIRDGQRLLARRRHVWIGTTAAAALAGAATFSALTGGNQSTPEPAGPIATVAPDSLPDTVTVSCSPDGIDVSTHEIRTQPGGVVLVVSSSMPKGSYLSYLPESVAGDPQFSGGEELPTASTAWTRPISPGRYVLSCDRAGSMDSVGKATVLVSDPDHNWRGTSAIDELGCKGGAVADWTRPYFQEDATEAGAVHAVAGVFAQSARNGGTPSTYTVEQLEVGYRDDPSHTWLVRLDGQPRATVVVTKKGDRYAAGADAPCGPDR